MVNRIGNILSGAEGEGYKAGYQKNCDIQIFQPLVSPQNSVRLHIGRFSTNNNSLYRKKIDCKQLSDNFGV